MNPGIHELVDSSSYYIILHIDSGIDNTWFNTRYRFATRDIARSFVNQVYDMDDVMASEMIFFETVYFPTYSRPKYDNIVSAMEDLSACIYYCKHYDTNTAYKYKYAVNEESGEIFTILSLRKENARLRNENMTLKKTISVATTKHRKIERLFISKEKEAYDK